MIGIGLVGYGYWGPNLLRNFYECPDTQMISVCDLNPNNLEKARGRYPSVEGTTRYEDLLSNPKIHAIAIATPVNTHYPLALKALEAGKHVFVEKPLTSSSQQAEHLIEMANKKNLILHTDHTFVYTAAVRKIKSLIDSGELGEIFYYDSVRVNLGLFQHDINVLWDLAVHDLAIMNFLIKEKPIAVSATGKSHIQGNPENTAYMSLHFSANMIAHIHVNWLSPVKIRQTLLGGSKKMLVYNDLEAIEKIKIYDSGVKVENDPEKVRDLLVGYRTGDVWSPNIKMTEALQVEIKHFAQCIRENKTTETDGVAGLTVVKALECAEISMKAGGRPVSLSKKAFV
jgi:predicted dehydrogenase